MKPKTGLAYTALKQTGDSDEDDNELFESEDEVLFARQSKHRLMVKGCETQADNIELGILGREEPIHRVPPAKVRFENVGRKMCLILSITLILVVGLMTLPVLHYTHLTGQIVSITKDWTLVLNDTTTESLIRLLDVDGDGKDDILIGLVFNVNNLQKNFKPDCKKMGVPAPCTGTLIALRGYDGQELWRTGVASAILMMNCHDVDVNNDGRKDCIVTGRQATIAAIDVKTGKVLWTSQSKQHYKNKWNIYQVSALPDFTSDGVPEVLVTHGGNPDANPTDHNRESGRLILLSGSTGVPLGTFYPLPQYRETYMTSVVYTAPSGTQYILYGTGGETVQGDLLGISVVDFYRAVMNIELSIPIPGVNVSRSKDWPDKERTPMGVIKFISGIDKGVMVPPVIVDVNNDNVTDLLVSVFDGHLVLLDGKTLNTVWTVTFPGAESYSTPAPGYFDGDEYLDFMFHYSHGAWDHYNYTTYVIVSGKDGTILWKMICDRYDMSSDLVLKTRQHRDLFILKMIGRIQSRYSVNEKTGDVVYQQTNTTSSRVKRHEHHPESEDTEEQFNLTKKICDDNRRYHEEEDDYCGSDTMTSASQEIIAIGQFTNYQPITLLNSEAIEYNYDLKLKPNTYHCHTDNMTANHATDCALLMPDGRLTGAIGDVDGNGDMDIVTQIHITGKVNLDSYEYDIMKIVTKLKRINIKQAIKNGHPVTSPVFSTISPTRLVSTDIKFLPKTEQKWLEYLGSGDYNVY